MTSPKTNSPDAADVSGRLSGIHHARNFTRFVLFEVFWGLGIALTLWTTILPGYLSAIGAPLFLISLMPQLNVLMALIAQPATMRWFAWRERRLNICVLLQIAGSFAFLVLGWLAWTNRLNGLALVWASGILLLTRALLLNMTSSIYYGVMMDITPQNIRGRLLGARGIALAITGVVGSLLCRRFLGRGGIKGYGLCFLIAFGFYILGSVMLKTIREIKVEHHRPARDFGVLAQLRHLLNVKKMKTYMAAHIMTVAAMSGIGLITVYWKNRLGGAETLIGTFTLVFMLARIIAAPSCGWLADRLGYRFFSILRSAALLGAFAAPFFGSSPMYAYLTFALLGLAHSVMEMWIANYPAELFPGENRVQLIAVGQMLASPVALGTAFMFGWLVEREGISLQTVFAVTGAFAFLSFLTIIFMLPEPRRTRVSMGG